MDLIPANLTGSPNSERLVAQLYSDVVLLCELQHDLAVQVAEAGFEEVWKGLSKGYEESVLEGIHRTMRIPDMEEKRQWCSETTMANLTA